MVNNDDIKIFKLIRIMVRIDFILPFVPHVYYMVLDDALAGKEFRIKNKIALDHCY